MSDDGEEETLVAAEEDDEKQLSTSMIPVENVSYEVEETGVDDATETMDVETTGMDTTNNSTPIYTGVESVVGSKVQGLQPRREPNYNRHTHGAYTSKKTG